MRQRTFTIALAAFALASSGCGRDRLAGWKKIGDAPWCAAKADSKALLCDTFSEKQCDNLIPAAARTGDHFTDPICVPNPTP